MLPQTVATLAQFIGQGVATFALDQTLALTGFINDHQSQFGVNTSYAVPITARGADFDFGGENDFFTHVRLNFRFVCFESDFFPNSSMFGFPLH